MKFLTLCIFNFYISVECEMWQRNRDCLVLPGVVEEGRRAPKTWRSERHYIVARVGMLEWSSVLFWNVTKKHFWNLSKSSINCPSMFQFIHVRVLIINGSGEPWPMKARLEAGLELRWDGDMEYWKVERSKSKKQIGARGGENIIFRL